MRKFMKARLAVFLAVIMMLPAIVAILPMASTEVSAADSTVNMYWWDYSTYDKSFQVEQGQAFYLGDYASISIYGKNSWHGTTTMKKVSYTSKNQTVGSIDNKGYFTAIASGATTVELKFDGKKLTAKIEVVPAGTFPVTKDISALKEKASAIAAKMPSKITVKNGFDLYAKVSEFTTFAYKSTDIDQYGFIKNGSSNIEYTGSDRLAVPQAGRQLTLDVMLDDFGGKNNPTSTRSAKVLKIKSVSATPKAVTVKLTKKVDKAQVLGARISSYNIGNEKVSGNKKAYVLVSLYDTKGSENYSGIGEITVGSDTMKIVPKKYSYSTQKYSKAKLKKGHTYRLEYDARYWTKGKTVKVK